MTNNHLLEVGLFMITITGIIAGYLLCDYKNERKVQKEIDELKQAIAKYNHTINIGEFAKLLIKAGVSDNDAIEKAEKFHNNIEKLHEKSFTAPTTRPANAESQP